MSFPKDQLSFFRLPYLNSSNHSPSLQILLQIPIKEQSLSILKLNLKTIKCNVTVPLV